jgi:hypothetical protein
METKNERGVALIIALLVMMLLCALGLSLTMVTSTEERVAYSYGDGSEALYAVDAALELAVAELATIADWNRVLDGSVSSSFMDQQVLSRAWPGGFARSSAEATAFVTCGRTTCTANDADARTRDRPWGANNPRWRLFAAGPIENASPSVSINSSVYVAVWVGDDPLETDDNALVDGDESRGPNPGRGVMALLVHAYGVSALRRIEATVERAGPGVRVVSWRELR